MARRSTKARPPSGEWAPAEALGRAREAHADLLADRPSDRGHRFWKGLDAAGAPVGYSLSS